MTVEHHVSTVNCHTLSLLLILLLHLIDINYMVCSDSCYKKKKEDFVTGHSGSSMEDIVVSTLLYPLLTGLCQKIGGGYPVHFLVIYTPIVLSMTVLSEYNLQLLLAALGLFLSLPKVYSPPAPRLQFISYYRGILQIATCIAILGVDFPAFPRRFCKIEYSGVSLMDTGNASAIFQMAVVSRHLYSCPGSLLNRLRRQIKVSLPLVVIGMARIIVISTCDYQLHVSEYGTHWNFFLTLSLVGIGSVFT